MAFPFVLEMDFTYKNIIFKFKKKENLIEKFPYFIKRNNWGENNESLMLNLCAHNFNYVFIFFVTI
jgi:hypothetical protein